MAVRAPIAFDYKGFIARGDLVPFQCMFARECPSLVGQTLGNDLVEMDQREYAVIQTENQAFERLFKINTPIRRANKFSGVFSIISVALAIHNAIRLWKNTPNLVGEFEEDAEKLDQSLMIKFFVWVFGTCAGILGFRISRYYLKSTEAMLADETSDNRLLRLKDKVRVLEGKVSTIVDEVAKRHMQLARDYFQLKHDKYLAERTNRIAVVKVN